MSVTFDRPLLKHDLEVIKQTGTKNSSRYLIRKPSGELYELGAEEYFLLTQLRGAGSSEEIIYRFEKRFGLELSTENLMAFIRNMGEEGLLEGYEPAAKTVFEILEFRSPDKWLRKKFFDPGHLTAWLAVHLRWVFSTPFVVASVLLVLFAALTLYHSAPIFFLDVATLFEPLSILQIMVVSYCFLNIPCELSRGMTSAHYGSRPTEFGIWLAYDILPRFYCRSRVLELKDRRKRNWTLFASSYCSIIIACISTLTWSMTPRSTTLHELALIIMVTAMIDFSVKLNVLWPTEVYYMLSNSLGILDFRRRSVAALKSWVLRRPQPEPMTRKEKWTFRLYGLVTVAATLPSFAVVAYLLGTTLVASLAGGGALLFLILMAIKYRHTAPQWVKKSDRVRPLPATSSGKPPGPKKPPWVKIAVLVVIAIIMVLPYPFEAGGPFKFLPIDTVSVHTQVSGEVTKVPVKEGDLVEKGQVLAYLDTREQRKNYDITKADVDRATSVLRLLEAGPKPEEVEKSRQELDAAKTRLDFSSREAERISALFDEGVVSQEEYEKAAKAAAVDSDAVDVAKASLDLVMSGARPEEIDAQKAIIRDLEAKLKYYDEDIALAELVSPIKGLVATPYIDKKVGNILADNELFATIHNVESMQAEVQVPESDIGEIEVGGRVKVRLWSQPTKVHYGTVVSIAPQAEKTIDGNVVRVLTEIPNPELDLRPDMTGEAKISGGRKPVIVAFTRMLVRFFMVEVWSWLP